MTFEFDRAACLNVTGSLSAGHDSVGLGSDKYMSLSSSGRGQSPGLGSAGVCAIELMLMDISKDFISVVRFSMQILPCLLINFLPASWHRVAVWLYIEGRFNSS